MTTLPMLLMLALASGSAAPAKSGNAPQRGSAAPAKSGSTPAPLEPEATASSSTVKSTYRISAGDQLEIYVWGDERLQRSLGVLPDGTFSFPLAGTVMAVGKTPNQVEAELSRLLASQYKGVAPQVTVSVRQTSGMQIAIIGKVRSPGNITPIRYITVVDALAQVGGPNEFADVNNIIVLRNNGGKLSVIRTHVGSVLKGKPGSTDLSGEGNPELRAGDTVIVP